MRRSEQIQELMNEIRMCNAVQNGKPYYKTPALINCLLTFFEEMVANIERLLTSLNIKESMVHFEQLRRRRCILYTRGFLITFLILKQRGAH